MCEPGKQCYEGESCGARLDHLKRLVWVLMIWVSILSLGLGASITLHIFRFQGPETKNPTTASVPSGSNFTYYNLAHTNVEKDELKLQWRKRNSEKKDTGIVIEEDGNYFLFFRATLASRRHGVNYTITVEKRPNGNKSTNITDGHINGTENSTGFIGIGVLLTENTVINVICTPEALFDVRNTYFGLIRF
ncbi:tumor necrosis factor ligand superfamily member 18 [Silurus meridionalis]|uniref:TNF family profile domain-containing protein n=1 Tax=Silurus meridionalis TaxID=175797 RepID=A0A8T0AH11_SILME|nr:tumor necrosis factor ligand superfamily member 18 [Silurus meridionalis]XP_046691024.1 tumor necrosis factor ligand superfamily member 18 [Silurus meridionalis]KAF7690916.1 hypothetical protein HF521_011213 [Silurus meridionalis]KAI5091050.1 TNF superfamily member 18 [Silurus meridionalis]